MWFLVSLLVLKYLLWLEYDFIWKEGTTVDEFIGSLKKLKRKVASPVFGILMLGKSDKDAGEIINLEAYKFDIAKAAGTDCWFLYFFENAPEEGQVSRNLHYEHVEGVNQVAEWLSLKKSKFPCFVLFEMPYLEKKEILYVSLKGLSKEGIVQRVREIFDHVDKVKAETTSNFSPFEAIKSFKRSESVKATVITIVFTLSQAAKDIAVELFDRLIKP
jgi:hypothetical protein